MSAGSSRRVCRWLAIAALAACAPTIDNPVEVQRGRDREDGAAAAAQLAQLPGAVSASVTIHRPVRDPLLPTPTPPTSLTPVPSAERATVAALIVVDDRADRAAVTAAATTLLRAAAPEVGAPEVMTMVGAHRAVLAKVGPFTVEAASKTALEAALIGALALIAGLAAWIAVRERRA
jgi:hypothetical protein